MTAARKFRLGLAVVMHDEESTTTTFVTSGLSLVSDHEVRPDQVHTADEYGMDPVEMNRTHDVAHSVLAALLGVGVSDALHTTAHGKLNPNFWVEERAVLALQSYAQSLNVDLVDVAARLSHLMHR